MTPRTPLLPGDPVDHAALGPGAVMFDSGLTVVVRFEGGIEECPPADLTRRRSVDEVLAGGRLDAPLEVLVRTLGEAVRSVNDAWGVFTCSRIALLPHQLWVCRQVNRDRPTRKLVADDVGLGKTIEAGLVLLPLISSGAVKRLLVLCPASLVRQWQFRMRTMFEIRLTGYATENDTERSDFWNEHDQVVASLHTLRMVQGGRQDRLIAAGAWDMVVVDEAHHLYADADQGPTLGYQLVERLDAAGKVGSMVFFTGTPHRGKTFGFLALLKLLRPDLFDPRKPLDSQLAALKGVMIRNNKYEVTDLAGVRLFQEPLVKFETYAYSAAEAHFYRTLTEFITTGKAYASTLNQAEGRAVMLVLIAMQKLASSSVAAIGRALGRRLGRTLAGNRAHDRLAAALKEYRESQGEESEDDDRASELEEELAGLSAQLVLMNGEEPRLRELVAAADAVVEETKVRTILELLDGPFAGRSVLFFTEYKATQSLLMGKLIDRYGRDRVAFINGDEAAAGVVAGGVELPPLREPRESAAERFNRGDARYLVSTEAGGEGIDLQEACHCLVHVDLPWNPMRLQQRVGRLNRYGQRHRVEVYSVRNPETVEGRIWEKLEQKIALIGRALGAVSRRPEDLMQLVLGMASPALFRDLFAEAPDGPPDDLEDFFNARTARFADRDALDAVNSLVGHADKFDFRESSALVPRLDLPDLVPFFKAVLHHNRRKVAEADGRLGFLTPDVWPKSPGLLREYRDVRFDRGAPNNDKLLGVGRKPVDLAVAQARGLTASACALDPGHLAGPLFVFRVTDRVTTSAGAVRAVAAAAERTETGWALLRDWELIRRLNAVLALRRDPRRDSARPVAAAVEVAADRLAAEAFVAARLADLDLPFRVPSVALLSAFLPGSDLPPVEPGPGEAR